MGLSFEIVILQSSMLIPMNMLVLECLKILCRTVSTPDDVPHKINSYHYLVFSFLISNSIFTKERFTNTN